MTRGSGKFCVSSSLFSVAIHPWRLMVGKNSYVVWCLVNQARAVNDYENFCSSRAESFIWKQGFALFLRWWKHDFTIKRMELCLSIHAGAHDKNKKPTISLQRGTEHNKCMCVRKSASALDMGSLIITHLLHITRKDLASLCVHSKLNLAHLLHRHIAFHSLVDIITYDEDDKPFQKYIPS